MNSTLKLARAELAVLLGRKFSSVNASVLSYFPWMEALAPVSLASQAVKALLVMLESVELLVALASASQHVFSVLVFGCLVMIAQLPRPNETTRQLQPQVRYMFPELALLVAVEGLDGEPCFAIFYCTLHRSRSFSLPLGAQ